MTSPLRGLNLHSALRPSHGWLAVGYTMPPATRALRQPEQKCPDHLVSQMTTTARDADFRASPACCLLLSAFCLLHSARPKLAAWIRSGGFSDTARRWPRRW